MFETSKQACKQKEFVKLDASLILSHNHLFTNKNQAVILIISIQIIHVKNPNHTSWLDPVIKLRHDEIYL